MQLLFYANRVFHCIEKLPLLENSFICSSTSVMLLKDRHKVVSKHITRMCIKATFHFLLCKKLSSNIYKFYTIITAVMERSEQGRKVCLKTRNLLHDDGITRHPNRYWTAMASYSYTCSLHAHFRAASEPRNEALTSRATPSHAHKKGWLHNCPKTFGYDLLFAHQPSVTFLQNTVHGCPFFAHHKENCRFNKDNEKHVNCICVTICICV